MYKLIDKKKELSYGGKIDPHIERLLAQHKGNVEKTIQRYQTQYKPVDARNPLLRLAYAILALRFEEPMKTYNAARDYFHELAGPLGITTNVHHGRTTEMFFGGAPTIIMGFDNSNPADYIIGGKNYKTMQPVKVLHVPTAEHNLVRPDLANHEYGYGVLSIDIPVFALAVAAWDKENRARPLEQREDVAMFLGKYVLPNAMYSQADQYPLALWETESKDRVSSDSITLLADVGKDLWKEIQDFKPTLTKATVVEDALKQIPGVFSENQYSALRFPMAYVPMQQHWGFTAAFMRPFKVALSIATDNQDGRRLKNRYKKEMRRIKSEGTIAKLDEVIKAEMEISMLDIDAYMTNL